MPANASNRRGGGSHLLCGLMLVTGLTCCGLVSEGMGAPPNEIFGAHGTNDLVIDRCVVTFLEEIEIPALDSGQIVRLNIQANREVTRQQAIAQLDDTQLRVARDMAATRETVLTNRLNSDIEIRLADASYEEAKLRADTNEKVRTTSPGSVPLLELRLSQIALRRAELERDRVRQQRAEDELQLRSHRAEVQLLDQKLQRLQVTSPLDGLVLETSHGVGEWVNQGEKVAVVARMDVLKVTAVVNETKLSARWAVGTPVTVRWTEGTIQHALRGSIASVDPQLSGDSQIRFHIEIENRKLDNGWLLQPGRRVVVVVHPRTTEPSASPATALRIGSSSGAKR